RPRACTGFAAVFSGRGRRTPEGRVRTLTACGAPARSVLVARGQPQLSALAELVNPGHCGRHGGFEGRDRRPRLFERLAGFGDLARRGLVPGRAERPADPVVDPLLPAGVVQHVLRGPEPLPGGLEFGDQLVTL